MGKCSLIHNWRHLNEAWVSKACGAPDHDGQPYRECPGTAVQKKIFDTMIAGQPYRIKARTFDRKVASDVESPPSLAWANHGPTTS